jgi:hypothetical protein
MPGTGGIDRNQQASSTTTLGIGLPVGFGSNRAMAAMPLLHDMAAGAEAAEVWIESELKSGNVNIQGQSFVTYCDK